ncbi:hypothetical protein D7030_06785 [Flavobacteriaceae bacterium AU392]|nr:hypothetical protein D1817_01635 [Flavobacteriaceae bacterium]RKM84834.1 hypothetical protein D7030_06785 [Flavobacteriaceae bacterium AU392]
MKNKHYALLVAFMLCFVTNNHSQVVVIKNGIGIHGGVTQFNILTDNFETTSATGFVGGFSATGNIPHKRYNVSFGLQFFQNNIDISGRTAVDIIENQNIEYNLKGVQATFMFHIKLASNFFTLDIGPQLQFNDKLELSNDNQSNLILNGYNALTAGDITDVSMFNANGIAGFTGGIGAFKLRAHYTYGFTNILNKLNDENLNTTGGDSDFKGNQSIITVSAMFTF